MITSLNRFLSALLVLISLGLAALCSLSEETLLPMYFWIFSTGYWFRNALNMDS